MIEIKHLDINLSNKWFLKMLILNMSRENNRNYRKKWLWKDDVFKSIDLSIQESILSIDKHVITEKNKEDYYCIVSVILINLEHSLKIWK